MDIQEMDILNLFWEPGISDLQKSRNVFSVELRDNMLIWENALGKNPLRFGVGENIVDTFPGWPQPLRTAVRVTAHQAAIEIIDRINKVVYYITECFT